MHIFNVKSVRDKNVFMESLKYLSLIIGHFHVKYMNFKLCDNVQRLNTLKDISLKLMLLLGHSIY
jgi:hypothetical protein